MKFPISNKILFHVTMVMALLIFPQSARSHPMPNSLVFLRPSTEHVQIELQLPLPELQLAVPYDLSGSKEAILDNLGPQLGQYVLAHIDLKSKDGTSWTKYLIDLEIVEQTDQNSYRELKVMLQAEPQLGHSVRDFDLQYDVIIHQLITHTAFVKVDKDWENGIIHGEPLELGVVKLDIRSGTVPSLNIDLDNGSIWKGFKSMFLLGMHHIAEGTDHMLFLLALLLPAPLLFQRKKWLRFGETKYTIKRLLKIVTAFTLGHSATLLIGAWGILVLPSKPVEILIAFSILVSAIHAIRPIFPGKEVFVAAAFGLVHGLAFAGILTDLDLNPGRMAMSILGFNMGIEVMQLLIVVSVIPSFILLSKTPWFTYVRFIGATLASLAALGWMLERIMESSNWMVQVVESCTEYALPGIVILFLVALIAYMLSQILMMQQDRKMIKNI